MPDEPCPAKIRIPDDHYGTFADYCHLPAGHDGPHRSPRGACDPPGWLIWDDPAGCSYRDGEPRPETPADPSA